MLRVDSALVPYLSSQPEYRMGYQKVVATLNTGSIEEGIIVNSQLFIKEGEIPWHSLVDWNAILASASHSSLTVVRVRLIPREPETLRGVKQVALQHEKYRRLANRAMTAANSAFGSRKDQLLTESRQLEFSAKSAGAETAPITLTVVGEIFKRYSAFVNDNRVTKGKGLTKGTFATTKEDADANIKTGTDAVQRYALPNPTPASNVFTITPPQDIDLKRGTTQPANNQPGGGVEVIFVNGAPDGTVEGPKPIPDK